MKQLILILTLFFAGLTFGQVKYISSALDSTGHVKTHSVEQAFTYWYVTAQLIDSADVITVHTGTNDPDPDSSAVIDYSQMAVINLSNGDTTTTITGDEAMHTYLIAGYKRKNIKLTATTWSDTTKYKLEAY